MNNPMMQALTQSRQSNPVSSPDAAPGMPGQPQSAGNAGDMAKYWSMMQEMNSKLDKVMEALSGKMTGKEPDPTNDGNEAKEDTNESGSSGY